MVSSTPIQEPGRQARDLLRRHGRLFSREPGLHLERGPPVTHELLQLCTGIGPVGGDIFCREAQLDWKELHPFTERRALEAARQLGLPDSTEALVSWSSGAISHA